jgi:hypothetical protein
VNDHTSEDVAYLLWDLRRRCSTPIYWQLSDKVRVDLDGAVDPVWIRCETMIVAFPSPGSRA